MTVRGGDSWCSVHQCSAPTTPGRVKGLVIVMINSTEFSSLLPILMTMTFVQGHRDIRKSRLYAVIPLLSS